MKTFTTLVALEILTVLALTFRLLVLVPMFAATFKSIKPLVSFALRMPAPVSVFALIVILLVLLPPIVVALTKMSLLLVRSIAWVVLSGLKMLIAPCELTVALFVAVLAAAIVRRAVPELLKLTEPRDLKVKLVLFSNVGVEAELSAPMLPALIVTVGASAAASETY